MVGVELKALIRWHDVNCVIGMYTGVPSRLPLKVYLKAITDLESELETDHHA